MRVHVAPLREQKLSRAMDRVAAALAMWAPEGVTVVDDVNGADLQVVHVIGPDAVDAIRAPRYALVQYCLGAASVANGTNQRIATDAYWPLWDGAELVWSYLDLHLSRPDLPFYHAPLGVDVAFLAGLGHVPELRDIGVMTSGYVSHPAGEAIEEMAWAAIHAGLSVLHLGPTNVEGMSFRPKGWKALLGISDAELAGMYLRSRWVSGLRHVEGFELPVLEGLCCGARPIVFDRADMRQWYSDFAVFVPESSGADLIGTLTGVLSEPPKPVSTKERVEVARRFEWASIASGFWERLGL